MGYEKLSFWLLDPSTRETTYGAGQTFASTTWYKSIAAGLIQGSRQEDTDENEVTNTRYVTTATEVAKRTSASYEFKANAELLAYFIGLMCANVATTGVGPYVHTIESPPMSAKNPWSTKAQQSHIRSEGASNLEYRGLTINSLEFSINEIGALSTRAEILGSGYEETAVIVAPTVAIEGGRFFRHHLSALGLGPATEDITNIFRSLTVRMNANYTLIPTVASGLLVGEVVYGDGPNPTLEVELVVKGTRGDNRWAYWKNRTSVKFGMTISRNASNSLALASSQVKIVGEAGDILGYDETGPILTLPLRFEFNATDDAAYIWTATNGLAAMLAAA